ncbi:MAG: GGDEF domain-containing protein [Firmicutes bacterium]|nr:GGDEF domain-containing protein [Bacillota bacterium]
MSNNQRIGEHPPQPWRRVERIVGTVTIGYTILIGLIGWRILATIPVAQHPGLLRLLALSVALTLLVLGVIRFIVLRHLVVPLQRIADMDALTGLYRQGAFWSRLEQHMGEAAQSQQPLAFVFIDMDDFKQLNDTYGHLAGNAVLQAMGSLLRTHARQTDTVGRLGGEEFGWIMPGSSADDAFTAAHRLLAACQTWPIEAIAGWSFSAGIAGITGTEDESPSPWDIAREADHVLYQAKRAGKGRVGVATRFDNPPPS